MRTTLAVLLLLAVAPLARAGEFEDACAAARAQELPRLIELAQWCQEQKLFKTRNELANAILEHDATNTQAMKWLKYRVRDGEWTAPTKPARSRNMNPEALAQFPGVRREKMQPVLEGLFAAYEQHKDTAAPGDREQLLLDLISLAPDEEAYRVAHGEVAGANGWELVETATGRARRAAIKKATQDGIAAVPAPKKGVRLHASIADKFDWRGAFATKGITAAATTMADEARALVVHCQASPAMMREALGNSAGTPPGFTVYVFSSQSEAERLFTAHPDTDENTRKAWRNYGAFFIGQTPGYAVYTPVREVRLESAARQVVSYELIASYGAGMRKAHFVRTGAEIRLTYELVGTRRTVSRRESRYSDKATRWGDPSELNRRGWYGTARKMLDEGGVVEFALVIGKPLNQMTLADSMLANAVAAYYLEGRPKEYRELLAQSAQGVGLADALRAVSGLDFAALRLRLMRWLEERGEAE